MNIYSPLHPAAFFMIQRRQREIRRILASAYPDGVEKVSLLEAGCGNGQWLAEFQTFGFMPENLAGIELDGKRAESAKRRIQGADIRHGNAAELPWKDDSFDIVFQSTVFTSVKDPEMRVNIASEMKRVCRKNGFILWYDFIYDSPKNPDVSGVGKKEVVSLFAPWKCEFRKITFAPPLARAIAPYSMLTADILETLFPVLRTHIIAKISP
jgi:ubiquinone/menaquinone biosynthesis C-methylase UbiE